MAAPARVEALVWVAAIALPSYCHVRTPRIHADRVGSELGKRTARSWQEFSHAGLPFRLPKRTTACLDRLDEHASWLAAACHTVRAPSLQGGQLYIIEANPRASRTVPFVAKAVGHPIATYASLVMSGRTLAELNFTAEPVVKHVAVKEVVLPFAKFPGADLLLGPEMRSTGAQATNIVAVRLALA